MSRDTENFIDALRGWGASVCLVAAQQGDSRHVMTLSSMIPVCLAPPSLLISVHRDSRIHRTLVAPDPVYYSISLLGEEQCELATLCADPKREGEERFSLGEWKTAEEGFPVLANAQATFCCQRQKWLDHGSHSLIIGEVIRLESHREKSPLLYCNQQYGQIKFLENSGNAKDV